MMIVTGATGFIGSNILADLNAQGRSDIVLVDELGCHDKWKNIAKRRYHDLVPPAELNSLLSGLPGADVVYHMGANSSTTAVDGDEMWLNNFRTSKTLWEWCVRTRTPLIYASSAATYGDGARGFEDDQSRAALDALRPLNLYGWSKHAFDKWAVEHSEAGSAPPQWCGLKFFNVYGPNENHKGDMRSLVAKNTAHIAAGLTIPLFKSYRAEYADGQQLRDFVYVKDCTVLDFAVGGQRTSERIAVHGPFDRRIEGPAHRPHISASCIATARSTSQSTAAPAPPASPTSDAPGTSTPSKSRRAPLVMSRAVKGRVFNPDACRGSTNLRAPGHGAP